MPQGWRVSLLHGPCCTAGTDCFPLHLHGVSSGREAPLNAPAVKPFWTDAPCCAGEKEEAAKRAAKQARKQERISEAAVKGVAVPKRLKRKQKKGVRIRKNLVVRVSGAEGRGSAAGDAAAAVSTSWPCREAAAGVVRWQVLSPQACLAVPPARSTPHLPPPRASK